MYRRALASLEQWKNSKIRKPLLLRGARQVGKTYLVRQHSSLYENFVEFNLEVDHLALSIFQQNFGQPETLCRELGLLKGQKILPGRTLLFIDEIQEEPSAIKALRYFKEEKANLHVIAAGSLLEFALKEMDFPVGRVQFAHMFPLDFDEFLCVRGKDSLRETLETPNRISATAHQLLMQEVQLYALLGGMPEPLDFFLKEIDFRQTEQILQSIYATYRADFNKYAKHSQVPILRQILDECPKHFGHLVKYAHFSSENRAAVVSQAIDLLREAGLVHKCLYSSALRPPLYGGMSERKFKLFLNDIGVSHRILGHHLTEVKRLQSSQLVSFDGLSEQFVAQQLLAQTEWNQDPRLFFWKRESRNSQAEIDFLFEYDSEIVPVEVKNSTEGRMKSLHLFLDERKTPLAIKVSAAPFSSMRIHDGKTTLINLPFYLVHRLSEVVGSRRLRR